MKVLNNSYWKYKFMCIDTTKKKHAVIIYIYILCHVKLKITCDLMQRYRYSGAMVAQTFKFIIKLRFFGYEFKKKKRH